MSVSLEDIERTYWDYLCAQFKVSEIDQKNAESYRPQLMCFPKLSDFRFFCSQTPVSNTDKRFWHVNSNASQSWYRERTQNGLQARSFGTIQGTLNHLNSPGIAAEGNRSLGSGPILLTPYIAVQHVISDIWKDYHINSPKLGDISQFLFLMSSYLTAVNSDIRLVNQKAFDQFCIRTLKAEEMETAGEYRNFTLCPLIENIRRYEEKRGNNFFAVETPEALKSEDEKVFWALAKFRGVYLAHNRHYPFLLGDKQHKHDFSSIQKGLFLDEEKISDTLEKKVIELTGNKDRSELHSRLKNRGFTAITEIFADTSSGKVPLYQMIHSYISTTLFLYENAQNRLGNKRKGLDVLRDSDELNAEQIHQIETRIIHFRNKALHEHIPVEEWMENPQRIANDLKLAFGMTPIFIRETKKLTERVLPRHTLSQRQERVHT